MKSLVANTLAWLQTKDSGGDYVPDSVGSQYYDYVGDDSIPQDLG